MRPAEPGSALAPRPAAELLQRVPASPFVKYQLEFPNFVEAASEKETAVMAVLREKKIAYPPKRILLRVFKYDRVIELWAGGDEGESYIPIKAYAICESSGGLGPKRREGDSQVPEGFYEISTFNPASNYFLSLQVSYPNRSDQILGNQKHPGTDIFIHGDCVTIGCIPITNRGIKELYFVAVAARAAGQQHIPIQIFPTRMDERGMKLLEHTEDIAKLRPFWTNLKEGYDCFEKTHRSPTVSVDAAGRYLFK